MRPDDDGRAADAAAQALARGANWVAVSGDRQPAWLTARTPRRRRQVRVVTDPSLEALESLRADPDLRLVCVRLSLDDRSCASQVLPYCAEHGVEVVARTSIPRDVPHDLDEALRAVMLRHGNARHTVALAWALVWAPIIAVATPVVRPGDVDEALNAAQLKLTSTDLDDIASALDVTAFGTGPTRPVAHA